MSKEPYLNPSPCDIGIRGKQNKNTHQKNEDCVKAEAVFGPKDGIVMCKSVMEKK
mgnify:FL=1